MMSLPVEYLELTPESLVAQQKHRLLLLEIEARKRAATVNVPTLPHEVIMALRGWGEPIRLFGEDLAAIRGRLRMIMARWEVMKEQQEQGVSEGQIQVPMSLGAMSETAGVAVAEKITETTYTHAPPELIKARKLMCEFSLGRSRYRLEMERQRRRGMVRWTRSKKRARLFDKEEDINKSSESFYNKTDLKEASMLVKKIRYKL